MEDFFFKLGRRAGASLRKGRWIWTSLTGSESEALEAEYGAGCDLARAFDRETAFDDDLRSGELLAEIAGRLTARLTDDRRRWRVASILATEPGAFALPGGFVYIARPLLELCEFDQDEIACVVGHEMGHVVRGHAMNRITNQLLTSTATRVARIPGGLLAQWILSAGVNLLHTAYSQDQELDADEFGARLAAAAGYDPRGAIRAFQRLQGLEVEGGLPLAEYFSSHPPLALRIEKLSGLIKVRGGIGRPMRDIAIDPPRVDGARVRFRWTVEPGSDFYRRCEFSLRFPDHVPIDSLPERVWWWIALACLHTHWALLEPCRVRLPVRLPPGERELWLRLMAAERAALDAHRGDAPGTPRVEFAEEGPSLPPLATPPERGRCATAFSGGKDSLLQTGLLAELAEPPILVATTSELPGSEDHLVPRRRQVFREVVRRCPVTWVEVESDYRSSYSNRFPRERGYGVATNELTDTFLYASALLASGLALGATHFFVASETEVQESVEREGQIVQHPHCMYSTATQRALAAALAPRGIHLSSLTVPLHSWQVQRLLWTRYPNLRDLQFSCWRARGRQAACNCCGQCLRVAYGALAAGGRPSQMGVDLARLLDALGDWEPLPALRAGEEALPDRIVRTRLQGQAAELIATTPLESVWADLPRGVLGQLLPRLRRARPAAARLQRRMAARARLPLPGFRPGFSRQLDPLLRDRVHSIYSESLQPEEPSAYAATVKRSEVLTHWLTQPVSDQEDATPWAMEA